MQGVLFGYGGIRFREDQIDVNPTKLPNTTSWAIRDVKYRGVSFDVEVHGTNITIHFKTLPENKRVEVKKNEQSVTLTNNLIKFTKGLATVQDDTVTVKVLEDTYQNSRFVNMTPTTTPKLSKAVKIQQNWTLMPMCLMLLMISVAM